MHKLDQPTRRNWFFWQCHSSTQGSWLQPGLLLVSGNHFISFRFERTAQNRWGRSVQFSCLVYKNRLYSSTTANQSVPLINVSIYQKALSVRWALLSIRIPPDNEASCLLESPLHHYCLNWICTDKLQQISLVRSLLRSAWRLRKKQGERFILSNDYEKTAQISKNDAV